MRLKVFDVGFNDLARLQLVRLGNVSVDESIFATLASIMHDLVKDSHLHRIHLALLVTFIDCRQIEVLLLHFKVYERKIHDILSRICYLVAS